MEGHWVTIVILLVTIGILIAEFIIFFGEFNAQTSSLKDYQRDVPLGGTEDNIINYACANGKIKCDPDPGEGKAQEFYRAAYETLRTRLCNGLDQLNKSNGNIKTCVPETSQLSFEDT